VPQNLRKTAAYIASYYCGLGLAVNQQAYSYEQLPFDNIIGWVMPAVRLSDHASFWDRGFKDVMVIDSAFFRNPYYHIAADTMDKLGFDFMAEVVESLMIFFLFHHR
jgi:Zn-dependent M28 family amino/carboxypeptidase